jgi:hypothetical protein
VLAVPRLCELYPGFCLKPEEKARESLSQVAARTSQADTIQYKNSEQYNTQKKNSNRSHHFYFEVNSGELSAVAADIAAETHRKL